MSTQPGRTRGRSSRLLLTTLVVGGLVAGACSKKDDAADGTDTPATTVVDDTTAEPTETTPDATAAPGADTTVPDTTEAPVTASEPVYGGILRVSGEAEAANPWTPSAVQCDQYCYVRAAAFYDTLVARNADGEYTGVLVESYEPNADFTEWTFKVRPGITFHDGTPLDGAAVVYNLQEHATALLTAAAVADFGRNPDGSFAIELVDDMTFTIKTGKGGDLSQPRPWATLPAFLAGQLGFIASPTWLEAVKADPALAATPVGTGPFVVESYAPRDKLVVKRNENYWRTDAAGNQLPYLDGVEFRVIEDSETAAEALQNGDIDVFATSASVVIADFRELADEFPMPEQDRYVETNYTMIDLDKPGPLQDRRVRCALSKAVDRQELIDLTGGGILQVANGLFSPGQEGYLEDNGFDTAQDIEGAQALIDEYLAENPGPIEVTYGTTVTAINSQTAQLISDYWAEIGVDTNIVQIPQDQYITKALFGDPDYVMFGWRSHGGTLVDAQYLWWHSSTAQPDGGLSLNFARLRDPVVDENLDAARGEPDPAKRQEFAANVNRRMAEECLNLPGSWTLWGVPHQATVLGVGEGTYPDGSSVQDNGGFFSVGGIWLDEAA
jgi:peptide/nickel transport system substrate-binding protein